MSHARSILAITRRVVGLILLSVGIPGSVVMTRKLIVGNDRLLGFDETKLLVVFIAIALIGASLIGSLKLPRRQFEPPSSSPDGEI